MRKFNFEEFIGLLILVLLLSYISFLMFSGNIYNYLSEKSAKNLGLALVILPILIISQIFKVFTFTYREDKSIKFLPIILTLFLGIFLLVNNAVLKEEAVYNFSSINLNSVIEINHENHYILENIQTEGKNYIDKYIVFTGFVYKYEGDKFILGREEMNCCAADSYIIGIKSLYHNKFKEGQWIKVLGKIRYDGEYYLNIEEAIKINSPKNIYF